MGREARVRITDRYGCDVQRENLEDGARQVIRTSAARVSSQVFSRYLLGRHEAIMPFIDNFHVAVL